MRTRNLPKTITVLFLLALVMGALAGCGGSGEEGAAGGAAPSEPREEEAPVTTPENPGAPEPPTEEEDEEGEEGPNVVVRLTGTPGTVFAGSYGNLEESTYEEGVLEEPLEWEVDVRDNGFDVVNASFVKPRPDEGTLKAEIIVDGEVVTESSTSIQYGALNVSWSFGG